MIMDLESVVTNPNLVATAFVDPYEQSIKLIAEIVEALTNPRIPLGELVRLNPRLLT